MPTVSLRFPVIWAPENFEAHTAKRIGDRTQAARSMWSYVDVRDAARSTVLALGGNPPPASVLNISARWPFSQSEINGLVEQYYGAVEKRAPVGENAPVYSAVRAEKMLGFRAAYKWTAEGIQEFPE
jgi:nucleoside-diphosphate-sugar epimerase